MDIVTGRLSTAQVVEKAKEYDASVNEFLSAVLIMSVYRRSQREKSAHQKISPSKFAYRSICAGSTAPERCAILRRMSTGH